jgi:hypothetical protein
MTSCEEDECDTRKQKDDPEDEFGQADSSGVLFILPPGLPLRIEVVDKRILLPKENQEAKQEKSCAEREQYDFPYKHDHTPFPASGLRMTVREDRDA